ncbi:uncharacterized protein LOC143294049 [Babylonia areolata]|uniref:uncharacterized protein LOC143294049 n=1 Tax=Babylonia areolata TaxID=304850 RepID=UPI003FCFBE2F
MTMNSLQQLFTALVVAHLALFTGCGQGAQAEQQHEETAASSSFVSDHTVDITPVRALRQKRAPGWGKRSDEDLDTFDGDDMLNDLDDDSEAKRAPGWGKREFDAEKRAPGWGKRAPGWGKRAPGWGKRAPGWGKRAPGWGKRAPGWGKRAPGWGKRNGAEEEEKDKRAPGWGKRAPGWGKRAPGWGKRAPGWGKRSVEGASGDCKLWSDELEFFVSRAIETQTRLESLCGTGSSPAAMDLTSRK